MTVAWSFSRLNNYRKCKLLSYYKDYAPKHEKIKEPPNPIFEKGKQWHKQLEDAVQGKAELPAHLLGSQPIVSAFRKFPEVYVEQQLAFDESLREVSWFGSDAWCRVIWDVAALTPDRKTLVIGDWKTGKPRPDSDQLDLFAASGFARFPSVEKVQTNYFFVEHRKYSNHTTHKKAAPHIWQRFGEEASMIATSVATNDWPAEPGHHCKWCIVPKSKCQHSHREG